MCGRFTLHTSKEVIESELDVEMPELDPSYNIAPTQQVLALAANNQKRKAGFLQWGLIPHWSKDTKVGSKMINARSETVDEKPSFKKLLPSRRCLIIADGFYEWKKQNNHKQPYHITVNGGEVFTFAGLWDRWIGEDQEIITCTMLTTNANHLMSDIHERMPVILDKEARETWLNPSVKDTAELKELLLPYDSAKMEAYPISNKVNNPRNNYPGLIESLTDPS